MNENEEMEERRSGEKPSLETMKKKEIGIGAGYINRGILGQLHASPRV